MRYLSVDLGASNGKVLAGELRNGKLCYETVYRFKNNMVRQDGCLMSMLESARALFKHP